MPVSRPSGHAPQYLVPGSPGKPGPGAAGGSGPCSPSLGPLRTSIGLESAETDSGSPPRPSALGTPTGRGVGLGMRLQITEQLQLNGQGWACNATHSSSSSSSKQDAVGAKRGNIQHLSDKGQDRPQSYTGGSPTWFPWAFKTWAPNRLTCLGNWTI